MPRPSRLYNLIHAHQHRKQALKEGKTHPGATLRCWVGAPPEVPRILAAAGLAWTYLDSEHGGFDLETLQDLIRAANDAGLCPIVRVADLQYPLVARALDCGAQGVLFPRVESPELLEKAISWTRFPPEGVRGFGLQPTHLGYEIASMPEIIAHMNANTMVVLQIETKTALERIDELLSVPKDRRRDDRPGGPLSFARRAGPVRAPQSWWRRSKKSATPAIATASPRDCTCARSS